MGGRITPAKTSGLSKKGSKWETTDSLPTAGSPVMDALPTEPYQNGWWYY